MPRYLISFLTAFLSSLIVAAVLPAVALAKTSSAKTIFLAELSPLRTVMGAPELRFEALKGAIGGALKYSQERRPSERADYTDHSQILRVEAMWYPLGVADAPIFLGAGLQHEDTMVGRQQERSHITWARTNAAEANDRWVNHDSYVSVTQTAGYRYFSASLVTASLAVFRDELVAAHSRNEETSDIYSTDPDLKSRGRRHLRSGVTLQLGMYFK